MINTWAMHTKLITDIFIAHVHVFNHMCQHCRRQLEVGKIHARDKHAHTNTAWCILYKTCYFKHITRRQQSSLNSHAITTTHKQSHDLIPLYDDDFLMCSYSRESEMELKETQTNYLKVLHVMALMSTCINIVTFTWTQTTYTLITLL